MNSSDHGSILISLESRHADNVFSGIKTVEFRRRSMDIQKGTSVWIYVKMPIGLVVGKATVDEIFHLDPTQLWEKFSLESGLSKSEFFDYFEGVTKGFAILLKNAEYLNEAVPLASLREVSTGFQPPQFFMRLGSDSPVLNALIGKKDYELQY